MTSTHRRSGRTSPFDRVLQGVLDVTEPHLRRDLSPGSRRPGVASIGRVYEMLDGDRLVGRLYLDLYPRAGSHPTRSPARFVRARRTSTFRKRSWSPVCRADAADDPGLMTHDEVRTLFHEFGHIVHRLVGGHRTWYG